MNTALILTVGEWRLALDVCGEPQTVAAIELKELFPTGDEGRAAAYLIEKRLAHMSGGALSLEPVLRFFAEQALSAAEMARLGDGALAMTCPSVFLLITRYEHIDGAWRIAPFQTMTALTAAYGEEQRNG